MRETFGLIVIAAGLPVSPIIIVVVGLVLAVVVLIGAFLLFRSSGKSKKGAGAASTSASADWQRQQQWNQQGMGAQVDNPWGQPAQPQQQQGWGTQEPGFAQQQQQASPWMAQGAQSSPQQQGTPWAAQGTPGSAQQSANPWGGQGFAQQQQQASPWMAQGAQSSPQQPGSPWSAQGMGSQPSWDATQAASQEPWGQATPSQQAQPQSTPAWGMQGTPSAQSQQAPTAFGGAGANAGPSWPQPAQQAQQPQQTPPADPWAQQPAQQGWGQNFQQQSQPTPSGGTPASSWQQGQGQGFSFGQQGMVPGQGSFGGVGSPGAMKPETASPFGSNDADRTILRPGPGVPGIGTGLQGGRIGIVRVKEGKEPGKIYEIRKESLSIGRSRESDIFLEDLAVSRLHASIVRMEDGNYALRDEGSANGTKVNNQTVNKFQNYPLQEGDEIQLGQTVLVFARR